MKHTFANRPSHQWMIHNLDKIEEVEAWFEGLERDLRERIERIDQLRAGSIYTPEEERGIKKFIQRELLGEESP